VFDDHLMELLTEPRELWPFDSFELLETAIISESTTNHVMVGGESNGSECIEGEAWATVRVEEPPEQPLACNGDSKVAAITFEYMGGDCTDSLNQQDKPHERCVGPDPGGVSSVVATKDADKITIEVDGDLVTFSHKDGKLRSDTAFNVTGPLGTQSLKVHTSCSKPLAVGDQFGSMKVVDMVLIPK
jgi:hypothetical protein